MRALGEKDHVTVIVRKSTDKQKGEVVGEFVAEEGRHVYHKKVVELKPEDTPCVLTISLLWGPLEEEEGR